MHGALVSHGDGNWLVHHEKKNMLKNRNNKKCLSHQFSLLSPFRSYFLRSRSTCIKPRQKLPIRHWIYYERDIDKLIKNINIMHQCITTVWETPTQGAHHLKHFTETSRRACAFFFYYFINSHVFIPTIPHSDGK